MNKLVVITSSINPRKGHFTYSPTRTHFNAEERFRQTIFTVNSLKNSLPGCNIAIVDTSEEYSEYQNIFSYFENVQFIPIKEISGEVFETVNTHPNKSHCECLLLNTFYRKYKNFVKEHDFVFKTSGRYFNFNLNDKLLTEENKDKFFFKHPQQYKWDEGWGYQAVDTRQYEGHDFLRQYCTVLYGFGISNLERFIDMNEAVVHLTNQPSMNYFDIETFYYYFTRAYIENVMHTDWVVSGWDGVSGRFMYY
jgi:hypothetical protein